MRSAAAVAAALLAGCGATPDHVVEQGLRHEFASTAAPLKLASCTTENANSISPLYAAYLTELVRPDSYQVAVHRNNLSKDAILVAYAMPAAAGSQLLLYSARSLDPARTADWVARLRRGC